MLATKCQKLANRVSKAEQVKNESHVRLQCINICEKVVKFIAYSIDN